MRVGLLTDRINNKLRKSNVISEHAPIREPVPLIHWQECSTGIAAGRVQIPARVNFFQAYSFCNCTSCVFNAIIVFVFLHIFFCLNNWSDFFFLLKGTSQIRTPIRKRQFNTPMANTDKSTPQRRIPFDQEPMKTFTLSATSKMRNLKLATDDSDFASTQISLTKEFEAMSSPAKSSLPARGQNMVSAKGEVSVVQANSSSTTPLRIPSSFTAVSGTNTSTSNSVSSLGTVLCQNSLNKPLRCPTKQGTPHPKICWGEKHGNVSPQCTSPEQAQNVSTICTPMRDTNQFNLSGIQPLKETPAEKNQRLSSGKVLISIVYSLIL